MKVLISGANGMVGSELVPRLRESGHETYPLVRGGAGEAAWWNPDSGELNFAALNKWRPETFIHLAGENIGARRWSEGQKQRIRVSRVEATERLVASLLKLDQSLRVFIGASAVGYYGNRGEELLTEQSSSGNDFLSGVARGWEQAAEPLSEAGARVMHFRFGMILSCRGGALGRMLPLFKWGLGGRLGTGKQWVSWIALKDVVRLVTWGLTHATAHDAYNAVSPNPVTNAEFTRTLGRVVRRPAIFPVPATALRVTFGEMADALLLTSQRVVSERLLAEGFKFELPELEEALRREIQTKR